MIRKFLLLSILVCKYLPEKPPSVVTNSGAVTGQYLISFYGNRYEAYQGIPYALPPIGERRFKPPVPIEPWSGNLEVNGVQSSCWQLDRVPFSSGSFIEGDEDCLYLNIFVPERRLDTTLPVLFWIHGGGFQYGAVVPEEEAFLMDYQVILVTIQYRLGALGFLSTEDEVVPGNMGLKDQSLALRWVHENIEYFGGDPNRITIYGHSAGGASVHYHYLSPMSAGLFQNGISFSGTAFNSWAQTENPSQSTLMLGKLMNCTMNNMEEIVQCLRECRARDLVQAQLQFKPAAVPFGPVVEKISENPFIDRSPREIIDSGKAYDVPWITGIVREEGLFPVAEWTDDSILKEINDAWDQIAPFFFDYYHTIPHENHTRLAQTIKKHYFGEKLINKDTFMTLVHTVGDRIFIVDAETAARIQAKANKSPVWFYHYTHQATVSTSFRRSKSTEYLGVCHGDDVYLFMKDTGMSATKCSKDVSMRRQLITTLISFANEGSPDMGVQWSRVEPTKDFNYLEICGPGCVEMKTAENLGEMKFWNSIEFDENKLRS